jgi:type I restriction enzyme S subunit
VVLPPRPLQEAFGELLAPMWARQEANNAETETLVSVRNVLLPKLISGELRVKNAETLLESVS